MKGKNFIRLQTFSGSLCPGLPYIASTSAVLLKKFSTPIIPPLRILCEPPCRYHYSRFRVFINSWIRNKPFVAPGEKYSPARGVAEKAIWSRPKKRILREAEKGPTAPTAGESKTRNYYSSRFCPFCRPPFTVSRPCSHEWRITSRARTISSPMAARILGPARSGSLTLISSSASQPSSPGSFNVVARSFFRHCRLPRNKTRNNVAAPSAAMSPFSGIRLGGRNNAPRPQCRRMRSDVERETAFCHART